MTAQVTSAAQPTRDPACLGASLRMEVTCSPALHSSGGVRHQAVVRSNWSIATPHNLTAERTAAALGGYCDCLTLLDTGVHAAREWLALHLRQRLPDVWFSGDHGWRVASIPGCSCSRVNEVGPSRFTADANLRFRWVDEAVSHATSVRHIAAKHGAQLRHVGPLSEVLAAHWRPAVRKAQIVPDLSAPVHDPGAPRSLWRAGIHPSVAKRFAARVPSVRTPIPLSYFIGMAYATAYAGRDEELLRQCDPKMAAWLVWSPDCPEPGLPLAYASWLGIPRMDQERSRLMLHAGYDSTLADELASALEISVTEAATLLANWVLLDCLPTLGDLVALGATVTAPSADLLQAALDSFLTADAGITRTQVALLLASAGRVEPVLDAIGDGVRTPYEFRRWICTRKDH